MTVRFPVAFAVALLPLVGQAAAPAAPAGTSCANLAALTIPNITIKSANPIAAGPFSPTAAATPLTLPAFCRVEATARPTSDSEIKFEVWLPPAEALTMMANRQVVGKVVLTTEPTGERRVR